MRRTAQLAAIHGALWGSDRWYRLCCYVGPASLALLTVGWICIGPVAPVRPPLPPGSWGKPLPQGVKNARTHSNWVQDEMAKCLAKTSSYSAAGTAVNACTGLINTGQVSGRQLAMVHTQRGFLEHDTKPDSALRDYDAALKVQPDFVDALTGRAWIRMTRNEYEAAFEDLNKAIDLSPPASSGVAYFYRGYAFLRVQNYPRALDDLNQAEKHQPDNADILLARGEVEQAQENYEAALRDFDQFSKRAPKDARGLVWRGLVLQATGQTQEALAAMENALALDPGNETARTERDRLRGPLNENTPAE
jgi:tetratricopeptide (TPR) repeat protein